MRKHLIKSAEYWYKTAKLPDSVQTGKLSANERLNAMEQAYNHVESALSYILDKSPEAKAIFDKVEKKNESHSQSVADSDGNAPGKHFGPD